MRFLVDKMIYDEKICQDSEITHHLNTTIFLQVFICEDDMTNSKQIES